jgi:hypothetical protein
LAECVEEMGRKLTQLVEEEDSMVSQGQFTRNRMTMPTAHNRRGGGGVMGGSERRHGRIVAMPVGSGVEAGNFDRLGGVEGRENRREPPSQHGLAGSR